MCRVFRIEDLVASAFIGLLNERKTNKKIDILRISLQQLFLYKYKVLDSLDKQGKSAVIPISRDYLEQFLCRFNDYFYYKRDKKNRDYICLIKDKNINDLKKQFIIYIPYDVRINFENKENLEPIINGTK